MDEPTNRTMTPATSLSVVRFGNDFAFLGLYIADPAFRGKGIALQLWQAALARLDAYRIGLDGVPERQPSYRQSGFELAWRNVRYAGSVDAVPPAEPSLSAESMCASWETRIGKCNSIGWIRG